MYTFLYSNIETIHLYLSVTRFRYSDLNRNFDLTKLF